MPIARSVIVLAGVAAVAGCVQPGPPVPTVMATPGQGRDYATFQRDDGECRYTAERAVNGVNPGAAATQNGVASAAVGTGLGAAAGALLGAASGHAGVGAAIGAGSGLLLGSAVGANNAAATGGSIQHQYNIVYSQCMIGHGDQVQGPYGRYYGGPPPYYSNGGYGAPPQGNYPPPSGDYPPPPPQQGQYDGPPGAYGGPPPGY